MYVLRSYVAISMVVALCSMCRVRYVFSRCIVDFHFRKGQEVSMLSRVSNMSFLATGGLGNRRINQRNNLHVACGDGVQVPTTSLYSTPTPRSNSGRRATLHNLERPDPVE